MSKNTCYHCWNSVTKIDLICWEIFNMVLRLSDKEYEEFKTLFNYYNCDILCTCSEHFKEQHKVKPLKPLLHGSINSAHAITPNSVCFAFKKFNLRI